MITEDTIKAIVALHEKGMKIRQISRSLSISRNTVR
jgi:orotate phosphoribosyltransferase-like protein